MVTTIRALVPSKASRIPGTSRCGITDEYQLPGPSTTQSASEIAVSTSGHAPGSGGISATDCTCPGVVATSIWPRIRTSLSGSDSSSPLTHAMMSNGSSAIGRTRPRAPSRPATQSSPST